MEDEWAGEAFMAWLAAQLSTNEAALHLNHFRTDRRRRCTCQAGHCAIHGPYQIYPWADKSPTAEH